MIDDFKTINGHVGEYLVYITWEIKNISLSYQDKH